MERSTSGRAILHGLLKQIASYKFIATTHFLADCIGIIGILSKSLQRANITYCHAKAQTDAATSAVTKLLTSPGPNNIDIFNSMPEAESACGYSSYKTHDIKDSPSERNKFKEASTLFTEELVARLEIAFPDGGIMSCFAVFSPKAVTHDFNNLDTLCKHFSHLINRNDALVEFTMLEEIMKTPAYKSMDAAEFYKAYIHPNRNSVPNLAALAAIGLIVPVTSVDCERGISRYNYIKSDYRSSMSVQTTNNLLTIALESQPIEDFDVCFDHWLAAKDRRGYTAMVKESSRPKPVLPSSGHDLPLNLSRQ